MAGKRPTSSLFDDIFKLQNTAPETDIDPEDPEDGFRDSLIEHTDDVDTTGSSLLRKRAAIIPEDSKYRGKKTSRKDLYGEDEEDQGFLGEFSGAETSEDSEASEGDTDDNDFDDEGEEHGGGAGIDDRINDDEDDDLDSGKESSDMEAQDEPLQAKKSTDERADISMLSGASEADERQKGKALVYQLGVWDDLIKSRIALQKMMTACNKLPLPDTWPLFAEHPSFTHEAKNVHSSVRKLLKVLLELQLQLSGGPQRNSKPVESDEEITSSEDEKDDDGDDEVKTGKKAGVDDSEEEAESEMDDEAEEKEEEEEMDTGKVNKPQKGRLKQSLKVDEVEEILAQRHTDFQTYRNDTLSKWDEKTRLTHGKIKSKNFAAFEMSVLKQIEQILVNRDRLVKRLHQQRASYRILGQTTERDEKMEAEDDIDDDDDDVERKLQQKMKREAPLQAEIIDDNDFYHLCLRDFIELKQNEETDPVTSNKQWLEIQRLRNKQKRKVDTRASKGRKIRYNVKEKLKNYMTPYDKSKWSDEQKDDLFKALFGNQSGQQESWKPKEAPTINIGL